MTVALEAGLVGRDEPTLLRFYVDVFGFTVVQRFEVEVGIVYKLRRDAARLKLFFPRALLGDPPETDAWFQPGGWRYAALNLDDLNDVDALTRRARTAGCAVLLPPASHRPGARTAMIADPEGNAWELLAAPADEGGGQ